MEKNELFINRVYEIANELKVPLIDEKIYEKVDVKTKNSVSEVRFKFEGDEDVIRGFLQLANFYHTLVLKDDEKFYIPNESAVFRLESS
ncbi:MAG: hypothetical protein EU529_04330 [Promethearchaeota archaeon]|nr:MAG: hypothetical protein EU529_04330 [Candidatus Lokiarchaeota archaeon]